MAYQLSCAPLPKMQPEQTGQEGDMSCAVPPDSENNAVYKKNWQADQWTQKQGLQQILVRLRFFVQLQRKPLKHLGLST